MITIKEDSELMTNLIPANPIPSGNRFVAIKDEDSKLACFSLSDDKKLNLTVNIHGVYSLIDFGKLAGIQADVQAFDVQQSPNLSLDICVATDDGDDKSTLWFFDKVDIESVSESIPGSKVIKSSGLPAVHHLFMSNFGSESSYPLIFAAFQPLDRITKEEQLGFLDVSSSSISLNTSWSLATNPEKILDVSFGTCSLGEGLFVLYEIGGKSKVQFKVFRGEGKNFAVEPKIPADTQCIATFVDPAKKTSVLITGGDAITALASAQYTSHLRAGHVIASKEASMKIQDMHIVQDSNDLRIFYTTTDQNLLYYNTTASDLSKGKTTPLLAGGNSSRISGILAGGKNSKVNSLLSVDNSGNLTLLQQSTDTLLWQKYPFYHASATNNIEVKGYTVRIQAALEVGAQADTALIPYSWLRVHTSGLVKCLVNGRETELSRLGTWLRTDLNGVLTIIFTTKDASCQKLYVDCFRAGNTPESDTKDIFAVNSAPIDPAAKPMAKLSKYQSGDDLLAAKTQTGAPLIDSAVSKDQIDQAASALGQLVGHAQTLGVQDAMRFSAQMKAARAGNLIGHPTSALFGWGDIVDAASDAWNYVEDTVDDAVDWTVDTVENAEEAVKDTVDQVVDTVRQVGDEVADAVQDAIKAAENAGETIVHKIGDIVDDAIDGAEELGKNIADTVKDAINDAVDAVKKATKEVVQMAVTVGGEVYKFAMTTVSEVVRGVTWVLKKVKVALDKIIEFIGFLFNWTDILDTSDSIVAIITSGLDYGEQKVEDVEALAKSFFETSKDKIRNALGDLGGNTTAQQAGSEPSTQGNSSPSDTSVAFNWVGYQLEHNGCITNATMDVPSDGDASIIKGIWDDLLDEIKDAEGFASDTIKNLLSFFSSPSIPSLASVLTKITGSAIDFALSTLENIVDVFLRIVRLGIRSVKALGEYTIQLPIFSELWKFITGGRDLTLFNLLGMITAIPTTLLMKTVGNCTPPKLSGRLNGNSFRQCIENGSVNGDSSLAQDLSAYELPLGMTLLFLSSRVTAIGILLDAVSGPGGGGMSLVKTGGRQRVPAGMGFARHGSETKFEKVSSGMAFGKGMMHSRFKPLQLMQVSKTQGNIIDTVSVVFETAGVIVAWPQRKYESEEDASVTAFRWAAWILDVVNDGATVITRAIGGIEDISRVETKKWRGVLAGVTCLPRFIMALVVDISDYTVKNESGLELGRSISAEILDLTAQVGFTVAALTDGDPELAEVCTAGLVVFGVATGGGVLIDGWEFVDFVREGGLDFLTN
ncbi:hypothetical protein TWF281_011148 [Arthrobotrys megalospora]